MSKEKNHRRKLPHNWRRSGPRQRRLSKKQPNQQHRATTTSEFKSAVEGADLVIAEDIARGEEVTLYTSPLFQATADRDAPNQQVRVVRIPSDLAPTSPDLKHLQNLVGEVFGGACSNVHHDVSEQGARTVTIYDFGDKSFTEIPEAELAPDMIKAEMEGHEGHVWIDATQLLPHQGDYKHPPFEGELRDKLMRLQ
jgi:hypothetical protein